MFLIFYILIIFLMSKEMITISPTMNARAPINNI